MATVKRFSPVELLTDYISAVDNDIADINAQITRLEDLLGEKQDTRDSHTRALAKIQAATAPVTVQARPATSPLPVATATAAVAAVDVETPAQFDDLVRGIPASA